MVVASASVLLFIYLILFADYIFWKLAFVTAAVLIGYSCVDEWEVSAVSAH